MPPSRFDKKKPAEVKATTARGEQKRQQIAQAKSESKVTYAKLLQELKGTGKLWEDPKFPATNASINSTGRVSGTIQWLRPHEILKPKGMEPKLFTGGASRFDVKQGALGDCWLLAVISSLSLHKELFDNVVPTDQNFEQDYIGAFRFRFWRFGRWKDVIVDDRLPVRGGRLIYMHSADTNEFWSALLEKAYAKISGSYDALKGGSQAEAMEDFTGGMCETIQLEKAKRPRNLFQDMLKFCKNSVLMGCSIESKEIEKKNDNGLVEGHAYSVTDAKQITVKGQEVNLVRIRNPWGNSREWNGAWSDDSPEWKTISAAEKKKMGIIFEDDGENWMSYEDWANNFTKLEVCHLGPESLDKKSLGGKPRLYMNLIDGEWNKLSSAGGCPKFPTFYSNPQLRVEVVDGDEDDDDNMGTLIVGVMQKDQRLKNKPMNPIGYTIYRLKNPDNMEPLPASSFTTKNHVAKAPQFINLREVCGRHRLNPGHYVVVPFIFNPKIEGQFIVRIFSEKESKTGKMDVANELVDVPESVQDNEEDLKNARSRMEVAFREVARTKKAINAMQLKDIVNEYLKGDMYNFYGFDKETCRSMVALFDYDQTGTMEFDEFFQLYKKLRIWKTVFKEVDLDKSGGFDSLEFRTALTKIGYKLNNDLFTVVANRYVDPEVGTVTFDDFVLCAVRLLNAFDIFQSQPPQGPKKNAAFDQNTFLRTILYN